MIKSSVVFFFISIFFCSMVLFAYEVPSNGSDGNRINGINRSSGLVSIDTISLKMYKNVTPVFVNNRVIFLSKDGVLRSVDSKDVKKCYWELRVPKHINLYRASILYSGNLIFYVVDDNVYGIDFETGEIKWQKELRSVIAGSPIVIDNHLMIVTVDNYLYFFNVSDGSLLSSNQESLPEIKSYSSLSSASYGNIIVFSFSNGKIVAFNSLNGLKIWESNISHASVAFNNGVSLQAANNTVIAVDKLYSISNIDIESGNTRWSKDLKIQDISQIEEGNIAAIIDNKLVLISIDTGDFLWQYDLLQHSKSKNQWSSPVIMNGEILVIGNDGCIILIDYRSGALKLVNYILPSAYYIPILVDSSIYVVTDRDKIMVFH